MYQNIENVLSASFVERSSGLDCELSGVCWVPSAADWWWGLSLCPVPEGASGCLLGSRPQMVLIGCWKIAIIKYSTTPKVVIISIFIPHPHPLWNFSLFVPLFLDLFGCLPPLLHVLSLHSACAPLLSSFAQLRAPQRPVTSPNCAQHDIIILIRSLHPKKSHSHRGLHHYW